MFFRKSENGGEPWRGLWDEQERRINEQERRLQELERRFKQLAVRQRELIQLADRLMRSGASHEPAFPVIKIHMN